MFVKAAWSMVMALLAVHFSSRVAAQLESNVTLWSRLLKSVSNTVLVSEAGRFVSRILWAGGLLKPADDSGMSPFEFNVL